MLVSMPIMVNTSVGKGNLDLILPVFLGFLVFFIGLLIISYLIEKFTYSDMELGHTVGFIGIITTICLGIIIGIIKFFIFILK